MARAVAIDFSSPFHLFCGTDFLKNKNKGGKHQHKFRPQLKKRKRKKSHCASWRACRLPASKKFIFLRIFKDDIPWMFPAAVWAHACHGKLSHLVVSFIFIITRSERRESCLFSLTCRDCQPDVLGGPFDCSVTVPVVWLWHVWRLFVFLFFFFPFFFLF